jgi:glucose-1-phosphate adenylyltransferase
MRAGDPDVLAFVMAGGEGTRLHALTEHRCKPAVPFDGKHRLVDFVLSNLVNSGIFSIYLLVQYKSQGLIEHVRSSWTTARFNPEHFITVVPPQMRVGPEWFQGTADAVAQNLNLIEHREPQFVAVFGADHIYRMDVRQMLDVHIAHGADVSVATLPVPLEQCPSFGIVETDENLWIRNFQEKPATARPMPKSRTHALASMGNYIFSTPVLMEALRHAIRDGENDFGKHILPRLLTSHRLLAYDFTRNRIPGTNGFEEPAYWRDVGTVDAYFDAHFDTLGPHPRFCLSNHRWPIYASTDQSESAQIEGGAIEHSLIGSGCVIRRAQLRNTMLRRDVVVNAGARLDHCIVMDRTTVGADARLERAIVDQDNHIPPGEVIGGDAERVRGRFHVSDSGVVVVPRRFFRMRDQCPLSR